MHHAENATRSSSLEDSSPERLDRPSRLKATDSTLVPEDVLPDIIPVPNSALLYSNIHAQRERRLRLLIRRYTNQIQYGCRDINCTTPTCLSYRKRNTTGPLRPYTDLSTRTLACQLVEESMKGGKGRALLCPNEPVVPWYQDPATAKRRRRSLDKAKGQRDEGAPIAKQQVTDHGNGEAGSHVQRTEHVSHRPSHDSLVQARRRFKEWTKEQGEDDASEGTVDLLDAPLAQQTFDQVPSAEAPTSDQAGDVSRPPHPSEKKDIASFTQTLFDLLPLRLLALLPARSQSHPSDTVSPTAQHETETHQAAYADTLQNGNAPGATQGNNDQHTELENDAVDLPAQFLTRRTLRTLSWRSIHWLHHVPQSHSTDTCKIIFRPFIKQSFAYCFSDPDRLVNSVRDLQQSFVPRYVAIHCRSKPCPPYTSVSPSAWPQVATKTWLDVTALVTSLAFLDHFASRDIVLGSMFTALQRSYTLPHRLRNRTTGKRCRSSGESGERASATGPESFCDDTHALRDIMRTSKSVKEEDDHLPLSDARVAEMCFVALMSIASMAFRAPLGERWEEAMLFDQFSRLRNRGGAHTSWRKRSNDDTTDWRGPYRYGQQMIKVVDVFESWPVLHLLYAVTDVISHRLLVTKWSEAMEGSRPASKQRKTVIELSIECFDRDTLESRTADNKQPRSWVGTALVEVLRTVMLKAWDGRAIIQRAGPVGGALELLAGIYRERKGLNLDPEIFRMGFVEETFEGMSMAMEWLSFQADTRQTHILSYSFLFQPRMLVQYFRAINLDIMRKSYENAKLVYNDTRQYVFLPNIPVYGVKEVLTQLRPHMARYFVLTIRRDSILSDAINQIWRRQRRELMRPLRVRIGKDEGEDGVDYGGVQQEFFRVVFAEALRPEYGMFTVDGTTRMVWFQPGSFEPLYKFEALGILMSIAVYNGITVPVTFPLAFYRKLLGLKVKKLEHIVDGWPDLARGLQTLLDWSEGDVGDVIGRTYEFSYELCANRVSVDMEKAGRDDLWPATKSRMSKKGKEKAKSTSFELPIEPSLTPPIQSSPDLKPTVVPVLRRSSSVDLKGISTPQSLDSDLLEDEAALVTNANRGQYVKDYVLWLTHKSIQAQYEAFAKGFYTCLDRTALSIFTPEALKTVIEGHVEIDIDELQKTVLYEDPYCVNSSTIVDFWHVVRSMSPEQHRQLLLFVTASDRVPVNGLISIQFHIQKNGDDDNRLPQSSTCYGRLLLPQYSSREILREKLTKAIENCFGFGAL
ncbi:ubiquitin-protein ligase E3 A [Exophiala viscosa]|uniref:HECT-type E3 ubiquitin transferase n=1 Tax=Exophiala viscosa TaxID=2486360 RepID=A0AAN6DKL3_9EURO|nr:ubiquitin-protein ligase E3 A [Exophiala viscosa]KAI1628387.1 ubiquitin-protein ligase E3 A [Exophiala viscosa]